MLLEWSEDGSGQTTPYARSSNRKRALQASWAAPAFLDGWSKCEVNHEGLSHQYLLQRRRWRVYRRYPCFGHVHSNGLLCQSKHLEDVLGQRLLYKSLLLVKQKLLPLGGCSKF
jgi:hypothetical protein